MLRRVFEDGAWADRALHGEARRLGLDARERALAMRLAYGAVQRRATLDHLIETLAGRPIGQLEPLVLASLRLGLYQLAYADRVPAHAAVGESVELVKRESPGGAKLVNAVLRRGAREAAQLVAELGEATPAQAALRHSHPEWIAALWWDALGPDGARALMAADNEPAEAVLRVNTLRADPAELAARLPVGSHPAPGLPEGLVLEGPFDAFASPGMGAGQLHAAVARVDDGGAAAGAATRSTACSTCAPPRAARRPISRRSWRDPAGSSPSSAIPGAPTRCGAPPPAWGRTSTCAPPTPPCRRSRAATTASSSTRRARTWARSPRARTPAGASRRTSRGGWRVEQAAILRAGAEALRPGGTLVYSTCTISPAENEGVVQAFLAERGDFRADDLRSDVPLWDHGRVPGFAQTLPHRDGTEGFFIARLRREGGS